MSDIVRVGLMGTGAWGRNHYRTLLQLADKGVRVERVYSRDVNNAARMTSELGLPEYSLGVTNMQDRFFGDESLDAVIIATSPDTHVEFTKKALRAGKHALVEKPLSSRAEVLRGLAELSSSVRKQVMLGYTMAYHELLGRLSNDVREGRIGEPQVWRSSCGGNGLINTDGRSVIDDLMIHDVYMMIRLFGMPTSTTVTGTSPVRRIVESPEVADATFNFEEQEKYATMHASWLDMAKRRVVELVGSEKYARFEDGRDGGLTYGDWRQKATGEVKDQPTETEVRTGIRGERIIVPDAKPLTVELLHFAECVRENKKPETNLETALEVARVITAMNRSLSSGSRQRVI